MVACSLLWLLSFSIWFNFRIPSFMLGIHLCLPFCAFFFGALFFWLYLAFVALYSMFEHFSHCRTLTGRLWWNICVATRECVPLTVTSAQVASTQGVTSSAIYDCTLESALSSVVHARCALLTSQIWSGTRGRTREPDRSSVPFVSEGSPAMPSWHGTWDATRESVHLSAPSVLTASPGLTSCRNTSETTPDPSHSQRHWRRRLLRKNFLLWTTRRL